MDNRATTPAALARRLGVHPGKVLSWVKSGELRACNLATTTAGRARWRILPEHLEEFLLSRQSTPPAPRRRRRRQTEQRYYR